MHYEQLMSEDSAKPPYAHETATIDAGALIGEGTRIWHYCHISSGATVGERCNFGQNCFVAPGVEIGNNVKVQNNVSIYTGTIIEDDVFLGPSCVLTNVVNPRSHVSRRDQYSRTLLRRGVTVGANATIVCGTEIGRFAFVGAGTVVIRDVAPFAQVVGNPARQVGWRCQCGEKLEIGAAAEEGTASVCAPCGSQYVLSDGALAWTNEEH
ncbi:MAG: UDP-2-acetamido-3-amino-2,3-dideoxy-glucuronate N-acetyltransferase [Bradymonadia bacterium]